METETDIYLEWGNWPKRRDEGVDPDDGLDVRADLESMHFEYGTLEDVQSKK